MKTGKACQLRARHGRWIHARCTLASANGESLALSCDQTLGTGEGFMIDRERGCVMILLVREGEEWRDVASGQVCELKEA